MRIAPGLARASAAGLNFFIQPPFRSRTVAWVLIVAILAVLSIIDYLAGVELSLSLFYLIPISLAAGWLRWRAGAVMALISTVARLVGDVASVYPATLAGHIWWNVFAALLIFLVVAWLVDALVNAHRGLENRIAVRTRELADSIAERRRLELELLDATARERAAIGRELHDELGQHLVATALAAQVLAQQLGDARGGKEAHAIVGWIEQAIAKTRKLARGLLLARIDADRFVAELEELAASVNQGDVRCQVSRQGTRVSAAPGECAQLFRIAQEAIGNALRHGHARAIEITVATDAEACCLIIADNGRGFDATTQTGGMGLRIMEHRAQIIGASLAVLSKPGEGTNVICRLPIKPAPLE